jgi:hypothetical protein
MRKLLILFWLVFMLPAAKATAQTAEVTQLILNIEKLDELRKILKELKAGYDILFKGYTIIKDLSEGNFKLHEAFLDGLLKVSPAVKGYSRVKDIIQAQLAISKEYKMAYETFVYSGSFTQKELSYIAGVYGRLTDASLRNLDALTDVLTDKKLRASDDQRLVLIDQIYEDMIDKLSFLRHFNGNASLLSAQRENELSDTQVSRELFGIEP